MLGGGRVNRDEVGFGLAGADTGGGITSMLRAAGRRVPAMFCWTEGGGAITEVVTPASERNLSRETFGGGATMAAVISGRD